MVKTMIEKGEIMNYDLIAARYAKEKKISEEELMNLKPLVISSIKRYYPATQDMEDLIQEGFLEILEAMLSFDASRKCHFLAYVKLRLKYLYLNKYKKEKTLSLDYEKDGMSFSEIIASNEDIEGDVMREEDFKRLKNLYSKLSPIEKNIIYMHYEKGISYKDIAEILRMSYDRVLYIKRKAFDKLKEVKNED